MNNDEQPPKQRSWLTWLFFGLFLIVLIILIAISIIAFSCTSADAPTNVTATPNGNTITVSWTAPSSSVAGYSVQVTATSSTSSFNSIFYYTTTSTSLTTGPLAPGSYTFMVQGYNNRTDSNNIQCYGAFSTASNTATITTTNPNSCCSGVNVTAPTNLSLNSNTLTWNQVSGAAGYNIYLSANQNFTPSTSTYVGSTVSGNSYTFTSPPSGTQYVAVGAIVMNGNVVCLGPVSSPYQVSF